VRNSGSSTNYDAWAPAGPFEVTAPVSRTLVLVGETGSIAVYDAGGVLQRRFDLGGRSPGPFAVSDDRTKIAFCTGTNGTDNTLWVHDVALGSNTLLTDAAWCGPAMRWLPGSNSRVVFNRSDGMLYLHDMGAGSTIVWQDSDTLVTLAGKGNLSFGIDWDAGFSRAIVAAGVLGNGGVGVFAGDICNVDASHTVCNLAEVSNPAGTSSSWSDISTNPELSSDGTVAYFAQRSANVHNSVVRRVLSTGQESVLLAGDLANDGYGMLSLIADRYLFFSGLLDIGTREVTMCDVNTTSCQGLGWRVLTSGIQALVW